MKSESSPIFMRSRTDVRMNTPKGGGIIFPHFVRHFARRLAASKRRAKTGPTCHAEVGRRREQRDGGQTLNSFPQRGIVIPAQG
jgi:hypothetical protein